MRSILSLLFLLTALALVGCTADAAGGGESSQTVSPARDVPDSVTPGPATPTRPATSEITPQTGPAAPYPDLGAAPELANDVWLNTPGPLRLADLRGKVVLLDMWTFG